MIASPCRGHRTRRSLGLLLRSTKHVAVDRGGALAARDGVGCAAATTGAAGVGTGAAGLADLGLDLLSHGQAPSDDDEAALIERHLEPTPRVAAGRALRLIATSGIDISDGLAQDAGHLARASRCGARISTDALPLSPAYERLTERLDDRWAPALSGGEDYELLLSVPPPMARTAQMTANQVGTMLYDIGELVAGEGVVIVDPDGTERSAPPGWTHF